MSGEQLWYYLVNGERQGPVTADQLQELGASGQVRADTQVWTEDLEEWIRADSIEGLMAAQPQHHGPTLITGAAAQTAAPLGTQTAAVPLAPPTAAPPAAAPPAPQPGGLVLGGSLASGPHLPGPAGASSLHPGAETVTRIRSIGLMNPALFCTFLFPLLSFTVLLYLYVRFAAMFAGLSNPDEIAQSFNIKVMAKLFIEALFTAPLGFVFGLLAGLLFNLTCKLTGGLKARTIGGASW